MNKKEIRLYNMIFPIWGMILYPAFWIITMPFNFIIDSVVLILTMKILKLEDKKNIYKKSISRVFFFGYLSDIIISVLVVGTVIFFEDKFPVLEYLHYEPANNPITFLIMSLFIILAGLLIYFFNREISFKKVNIDEEIKHKIALSLAIFTAPYFFMISLNFLNRIIGIY